MFQQFKSIFPSASLNIRSISESVGLNDTDWNKGVERLEALKNEFQNINSMLLNRQDPSEPPNKNSTSTEIYSSSQSILELKATGQVIAGLKEGWDNIHANNINNFEKVRTADDLLKKLQVMGQLHFDVCQGIENSADVVQVMENNLEEIQNSAVKLMNVLANLEKEIDAISVDYERQEFEIWKERQERELMEEMANRRELLREKEQTLKQQFEEYDIIQRKKRLELYEANFNADLEDYKRRRETEVSSLYSHHNNNQEISTSLDQLHLDVPKEGEDLDQFLGITVVDSPTTITGPKKKKKQKEKGEKKKKVQVAAATISNINTGGFFLDDSSDNSEDEYEGNRRRVEILQDEDYQDL